MVPKGTVVQDGLSRCPWASEGGERERDYHDTEWGRPVTDEHGLFERISLEAFQAGLSWSIILRKRDAFRRAFADFDPDLVSRFGPDDVERLLNDAGIVRNRRKIEATITNARAVVGLRNGPGLVDLIWSHRPPSRPAPQEAEDVPATTPESVALSKALKRAAMVFVGPTTCYAMMQAIGLVNDHLVSCDFRASCDLAARRDSLEVS